MAKKTIQISDDKQICKFISTTVREYSLMDRLQIYELEEIAKSEQKVLIYLHMKKIWRNKTGYPKYLKTPSVVKQVISLEDSSDFIVEFYTIDPNNMFDEKGNLVLGSIYRQKIDGDGKILAKDHAALFIGYFGKE